MKCENNVYPVNGIVPIRYPYAKYKMKCWDFPSGAVVKNPSANAGDTGSSPGPGRSHMLWSN